MLLTFVEDIALGLHHCWLLIAEWTASVAPYVYFAKTQSVSCCFHASLYSLWPQVTLDQCIRTAAGQEASLSDQYTISNTTLAQSRLFSPLTHRFLSLVLFSVFPHISHIFLIAEVHATGCCRLLLGAKTADGKIKCSSDLDIVFKLVCDCECRQTLSLDILALKCVKRSGKTLYLFHFILTLAAVKAVLTYLTGLFFWEGLFLYS